MLVGKEVMIWHANRLVNTGYTSIGQWQKRSNIKLFERHVKKKID